MKIKKFFAIPCALVLLLLGCLTACGEEKAVKATLLNGEGDLIVLRADETDTGKSVFDALQAFAQEEKISFTYDVGDYGAMITSVNGVTLAQTNEFWAVYTSLETYEGVSYSSTQFGTYEYGGQTIGSASYGVSYLPLVAGEIYVITVGSV